MYGGHRRVKFSLRVGLEAHYDFEEGSGTVVGDKSGNGNDGTASGGMTWPSGRVGASAGGFDGTDDQADIGTSLNSLFLIGEPFTVSAMINKTSSAQESILSCTDATNPYIGMSVLVNAGGDIVFEIGGSATELDRITGTATLNDSTWHAIAVTHLDGTASNSEAYVDASILSKVVNFDNAISTLSTTTLTIGARDGIQYFGGSIDDLRIHSRVLTTPEIYELSIRE